MPKQFDDATLRELVISAGFADSGDPFAAARFLHKVLEIAPFYNNSATLKELFPDVGMLYLMLNLVENTNAIEHGSGIDGAMLTEEGEVLLALLREVDWSLPSVAGNIDFPPPLRELADCEQELTEYDRLLVQLNLCSCGHPRVMLAFVHAVLRSLNAGEGLDSLLPDPGMRQFALYQFCNLALTGNDGLLSDKGRSALARLDKFEANGYADTGD